MKRVVLAIWGLLVGLGLSAQNEQEIQICNQAQEYYQVGRLDAAVGLLNDNMKSLSALPRITALRVLALCYLEQDQVELAEKCVSQILKEDPYYNISLADPPRFVDMVERFKQGGEPTVTTASQQAESLSEVPVPVTLITEEMIRESGARTLSDLLALYVPSMSTLEGKEMNVAMRGVYSMLQEKVLVMLNGHRLNSRTTNSEATDYRTSLDKIKQIEVLRGPASSLYGNVALTAVVNIITKQGNDVDGVEGAVGVGNNSSYRADFLMGKRALGIDFMGWASVYTSKGEKRHIGVDSPEFYGKILEPGHMYINGFNHRPAYDFGFTATWNGLKLMFTTQETKRVTPYNTVLYTGLFDYDRYRIYDGVKPGNTRRTSRLDLSYEKQWNEHWASKIAAFVDMEECINYDVAGDSLVPSDRIMPPFNDEVIPGGKVDSMFDYGIYQIQSWHDYTYGMTMQTNYGFQKGAWDNSLLLGLQMENYNMQDNSLLLGDHYDRVLITYSTKNKSIKTGNEVNISPFAQFKSNWNDRLIFNGGLRFDYKHRYNDEKLKVFSPRLSLIYRFNNNSNIKLGYSHSFVDAPYLYRASTVATYQGMSLKPELMDALQLTYDGKALNGSLKYESNVYYSRLNDLVYGVSAQLKNAGSLDLIGMENVVSYVAPRFNSYLNFSYQYVINAKNCRAEKHHIYDVPSFILNVSHTQHLMKNKKWGSWDMNVNGTLYSKQKSPINDIAIYRGDHPYSDLDNELKARMIFNANLIYKYQNIAVNMSVCNLLNQKYYQGDSGLRNVPYPMQRINYMIECAYKF